MPDTRATPNLPSSSVSFIVVTVTYSCPREPDGLSSSLDVLLRDERCNFLILPLEACLTPGLAIFEVASVITRTGTKVSI